MQRPALYFPYVHIRDDDWLKVAALYWPSVRRLVPPDYIKHDSPTAQAFAEANILKDEDPGRLLDAMTWDLLDTLRTNVDRLCQDFSIESAVKDWDGRPWADGRTAPAYVWQELGWIHLSKFPPQVLDHLIDNGLAVRGRPTDPLSDHHEPMDAWIGLHPALAGAYMTALAGRISVGARFQPLTDQPDLRVATPSSDVRAATNLLIGSEPGAAGSDAVAKGTETYIMLALEHARPKNLDSIPAASIIECREKLADELASFRDYVERQQVELAELAAIPLTDRRLEAFAEHVAETVERPLRTLEKGLGLLKLEPTRSLLLAGSYAAPAAASPLAGAMPAAAAASAVTAAIGGAWWKISSTRKAAKAQSPVGYLLDVRDHLTPGTVVARARKVLHGTYRQRGMPTG